MAFAKVGPFACRKSGSGIDWKLIQLHKSYQVGDIDQRIDGKAGIADTYRITFTDETIVVIAGIASLSRF